MEKTLAEQLKKFHNAYLNAWVELEIAVSKQLKEAKPEWEIVSFKETHPQGHIYPVCSGKIGPFSNAISVSDGLKNDKYFIYSVRRLSDGEVFSVGDKIQTKSYIAENDDYFSANISGFIIDKGEMIIELDTPLNIYRKALLGSITKQKKQPLFTTYDGKEIFKGDTFWFIYPQWEIGSAINEVNGAIARLSTKEAAENYVFMNKPCLSLTEIVDIQCIKWDSLLGRTLLTQLKEIRESKNNK